MYKTLSASFQVFTATVSFLKRYRVNLASLIMLNPAVFARSLQKKYRAMRGILETLEAID